MGHVMKLSTLRRAILEELEHYKWGMLMFKCVDYSQDSYEAYLLTSRDCLLS
jgi:hypothetical protein